MRLGELMPMLSVSARDLNPEIKILQNTFPTLIVCPILGWNGFTQDGSPFSGQKCQNPSTITNFWASGNSEPDPADPPDPPDPPETQHAVQNRPWVPHAGGQDDGSLHKLPQIRTAHKQGHRHSPY